MGGYSFFDCLIIIVAGLILTFIVVRVLAFGMFKSYFQAKFWFIDNLKRKGGKQDGSASKKINEG
jgi:hypothetical protein